MQKGFSGVENGWQTWEGKLGSGAGIIDYCGGAREIE
ncbi:hypothetical protein PITCH_A2360003 [uncultured Desulfobacterium sp.]|uniref:Uncharacterized protein n=1 Tax=uncultured Desulfobacterium sp. TaxID=201089 RepID=A0A445MYF9_9BACT|nr:hypothetical protein PITCH_A2360003 [uncultured Desulfobacterium sp.]